MNLYDLLQFGVCVFSIFAAATVSNNHVAQPNRKAQMGWDGPISRRAKGAVTMERSRGGVCRHGGSFPIAGRCAAVS
jgi:hypothetical protein